MSRKDLAEFIMECNTQIEDTLRMEEYVQKLKHILKQLDEKIKQKII